MNNDGVIWLWRNRGFRKKGIQSDFDGLNRTDKAICQGIRPIGWFHPLGLYEVFPIVLEIFHLEPKDVGQTDCQTSMLLAWLKKRKCVLPLQLA